MGTSMLVRALPENQLIKAEFTAEFQPQAGYDTDLFH